MRTVAEALLAGHLVRDPYASVWGGPGGQAVVESSSGVVVVDAPVQEVAQLLSRAARGPDAIRELLDGSDAERVERLLEACGSAFRVDPPASPLELDSAASVELVGDASGLHEVARRLDGAKVRVRIRGWESLPEIVREPAPSRITVLLVPRGLALADVDRLERDLRAAPHRFFLVACLGFGVLVGPGQCGGVGCRFIDAYAEMAGAPDVAIVAGVVTRRHPAGLSSLVANLIEARILDLLRGPALRGAGGRIDWVDRTGATARRLVYGEYRMERDGSVDEAGPKAHGWFDVSEDELDVLLGGPGRPEAPPSMSDLLAFLRRRGATLEKESPFGRTLFDHLVGAHRIFTAWGFAHPFSTFALFHSVYASQAIRRPLLSLHDRTELRRVIGQAAELLVFLFSTVDRIRLVRGGGTAGEVRNFVTGETLHCPELVRFFELFELVNRCDLLESPLAFPELAEHVRRLAGSRWLPPVFDRGTVLVSRSAIDRAIQLASPRAAPLAALREATELASWWPEPHVRYAAALAAAGELRAARDPAQVGLARLLHWGTSFDSRATWEEWVLSAQLLLHGDAEAMAPALAIAGPSSEGTTRSLA